MVLAPFGPEVTVDPSGPAQNSSMASVPVDAGGTVLESQSDSDLDSTTELQGPAVQHNPWQEFQGFVAEIARIYQIAPRAAVVRIADMAQAFLQQRMPA